MGLEPMDALQTVSDCFKEVREILESFKLVSSADLLSELKMYKTLQGMSFTSRLNSTILQVHDAEKQLNEHFLPQKYASGDLSIFNAHQLEMVDMFMDWHRNPKLKEQAKSARDARASGAQQQYDRANRSKFREISENAARPKNVLLPATRNIFSRTRTQHPHAHAIQGLLGAPVVFDAERLHGALAREYSQVPSVWVDTDAALDEMLLALLAEPVIAVDLEHHSFLSYHGLTCLIQISSSTRDYLVDAIKLRESLQTSCRSLNRVLANADILKLVHGAESDIEWLQRDFDTYLVNVFDSFFAAKSLNLPRCSLAFLLQKYLSVELDKKYQLADWRERPLPAEMLEYARKDTHYLFALYAELSRELNRDQMSIVLRQSNTQCLVTFAATEADEEGWKVLLERSLIPLNAEQRPLARALYYWRDERVRALDISPAAFLSNAGLLKLAQTGARTVGEVRSALRHVSQWLDLNALVDFLNNYQASAFVDAAPEEPAAETVIVEAGPAEVKRVKLEAPRPSGRISFAAEQPKASASSLFAKKGGASGAAQVLSGLLIQSMPLPAADDFTTRAQAKEQEAELERAEREKQRADAEAKRVDAVPLIIHGSGRHVEHMPLVSSAESTVMQQMHKVAKPVVKKQPNAIVPHVFSDTTITDDAAPEQVVFDPYRTGANPASHHNKPAVTKAQPALGPRLSSTPASGNMSMTFKMKK